jgi:hypothetical protein
MLTAGLAHAIHAQGAERTVEGRVQRPVGARGDSTGMGPAVGAMVTLHRVARDSAGPLDSMRTDAAGRYRFRYRPYGSADAVYFASTTWDGIAYFTPPLRVQDARGDASEITVFDTTSKAFPLIVKGRHFIVSKTDSTEMRTVVEVFELSNDSVRTLVSVDSLSPSPTWSVNIPAAARDVRVNEGEISPDAFVATQGKVSVFAPIAPGVKQVVFSYKLPNSSFPLAMTVQDGAVVFELLVEEAQGTVTGPGVTAVGPVTLEGRNFRRFLAQDMKPDTRIVVELPSSGLPTRNLYIAGLLVGLGFLMLLVLLRSMQRASSRREQATAALRRNPDDVPTADRLAQEIAALDAMYARQEQPSESVQKAYTQRRAELKQALTEALADTKVAR